MTELDQILEAYGALPDSEKKKVEQLATAAVSGMKIIPNIGQQTLAYLSEADIIGYGGAGGGGKGLSLDTPLPTPLGWVDMRDVQPGTVLFDENGQHTRVLQVSEISHRPCYRLTFDDGSEIIADDVHRWVTMTNTHLNRAIRDTQEIYDTQKDSHRIAVSRAIHPNGFCRVVKVEPVESVPTKCIYVDSPSHQFLAGKSMIPTHNTYLSLAKAINKGQHLRSIIFRRESTQTDGMIASAKDVVGSEARYNGTDLEFSWPDGRSLKFAGLPQPEDWRKHAGRERDLQIYDEAAEFLESQVASLMAWNRGPEDVHCQVILPSNPPRSADGAWYKVWFAPWIDKNYPNPAKDGELRWCIYRRSETIWVDGPDPVEFEGEMVYPKSRTFIHAKLSDNPYRDTDSYRASLQGLPPVLSSQMLYGDFEAGEQDDAWQTVPTSWIREAQRRWTPIPPAGVPMCAMGFDVAQGGADKSVIAMRHDGYYRSLIVTDGADTPDGKSAGALIFKHRRDGADVVIDLGGGWGGDALGHLRENGIQAIGYMGVKASSKRTEDKTLPFTNVRSEAYWQFREALDPSQQDGSPIALPDDPLLVQELCAPTFSVGPHGIAILSKELTAKKIGRSPDRADAVVMAWWRGAKHSATAIKQKRPVKSSAIISHKSARTRYGR